VRTSSSHARNGRFPIEDRDNDDVQPTTGLTGDSLPNGLVTRRVRRRIVFLQALFRLLITVAVVVSAYVVLVVYERYEVLSKKAKGYFNAVMAGLLIMLALNVSSALNEVVKNSRWWILSLEYRPTRQVEEILRGDSLRHLIMLSTRSKSFVLSSAIFLWVLLSIVCCSRKGLCQQSPDTER
jgi:hypothetical protein